MRNCQGEPTPPPPYEYSFQPVQLTSGRPRPAPQEAIVRHISPRQPALCIIEDPRRENNDLNYHSTKF